MSKAAGLQGPNRKVFDILFNVIEVANFKTSTWQHKVKAVLNVIKSIEFHLPVSPLDHLVDLLHGIFLFLFVLFRIPVIIQLKSTKSYAFIAQ